MRISEMDRLVADAMNSPALQARLDAAGGLDGAVSEARAAGYDIDAAAAGQWLSGLAGTAHAELSDVQLDAVAGGKAAGPNFGVLVGPSGNGEGSAGSIIVDATNFVIGDQKNVTGFLKGI